tara:strand:+ start:107093 stop:107962 length:870 start_codon:yes stop_codon:yes gene_type:complete
MMTGFVRAIGLIACLCATPALADVSLKGHVAQGALVVGKTEAGAKVTLDGRAVMVSPQGMFALGFDRDHGPSAKLSVTTPDGQTEIQMLAVAKRSFNIQSITGVESKYVSPPPETLARIARERDLKKASRPCNTNEDWFAEDFVWPSSGPISGVYGSQRIFNGTPKNPHFGVDIAAPDGASIIAPADGIVRLAEPDMFYEGGLVFLDHGQGVFSQFLHMSRVDVKTGQRVKQGDPVGLVGSKGRSTGPHLHWGLLWCGTRVDASLMVPGIGVEGVKAGAKVTRGETGSD